MSQTLAQAIASAAVAIVNCRRAGNVKLEAKHLDRLDTLAAELPSGSGFDNGTSIVIGACSDDRLDFSTSYHHTDESGQYDGWTEHTVSVRPTFLGLDVKVSGLNPSRIRDYIAETFEVALSAPAPDLA